MTHALTQRLIEARGDFRRAGRLLRRVRRLYFRIVWPRIRDSADSNLINVAAQRMADAGMYAQPTIYPNLRAIRYSILRAAWKIETGAPSAYQHPDRWHNWYPRHGFTPFNWQRENRKIA